MPLTITGITASRKTTTTVDFTPIPSHTTITGSSASRGIALSAIIGGSSSCRTVAFQPISIPTGMPTATDSRKPIANALSEPFAFVHSSPLVVIVHPADSASAGLEM